MLTASRVVTGWVQDVGKYGEFFQSDIVEILYMVSAIIGVSLSEPHTSVTALHTCVCMFACLLACLLACGHIP